jgi:hypothetical protein
MDSILRKKQKSNTPKPPAPMLSMPLSTSNIETSVRKFNPYQYATSTTRPNGDDSSLYGSVNNNTNLNTHTNKLSSTSSECCSRQSSNASDQNLKFNNNTVAGSVSGGNFKLMKSKNLITREYFTVQNDYGILPLSTSNCARHYMKPPPPIAAPQLPLQHRLSSTSSSTDSSYCAAYNLINSQTCLLNGTVAPKQQPQINSSSEVRDD